MGFTTGLMNKTEPGTLTKNYGANSFLESCSNIFLDYLVIRVTMSVGLTAGL